MLWSKSACEKTLASFWRSLYLCWDSCWALFFGFVASSLANSNANHLNSDSGVEVGGSSVCCVAKRVYIHGGWTGHAHLARKLTRAGLKLQSLRKNVSKHEEAPIFGSLSTQRCLGFRALARSVPIAPWLLNAKAQSDSPQPDHCWNLHLTLQSCGRTAAGLRLLPAHNDIRDATTGLEVLESGHDWWSAATRILDKQSTARNTMQTVRKTKAQRDRNECSRLLLRAKCAKQSAIACQCDDLISKLLSKAAEERGL